MNRAGAGTVLDRLRARREEVSAPGAEVLVTAIASVGESFSASEGFIALSEQRRAALFIRELLARFDASERLAAATAIVTVAQPLTFAANVFSWLRSSPEEERQGGGSTRRLRTMRSRGSRRYSLSELKRLLGPIQADSLNQRGKSCPASCTTGGLQVGRTVSAIS